MKPPFRQYLADNLVLADGAMGTLIYARGYYIDKCYDELNISNPGLISNVHKEYLQAGAVVLETNTFGANRCKLAKHHLEKKMKEINTKGVELAVRAIGSHTAYAAGSMGPLGVRIEPWGTISLDEARTVFWQQAEVLQQAGAELFILETFNDIREMELAVEAVRQVSDLPLIAQITVQEDGKTLYGVSLEDAGRALSETAADVIGLNCALGPKTMLDFAERLVPLTAKPLSVMPNAGLPRRIDGRTFYMSTPEYFGVYAKRFIEAGVRVIGGCCGTTPDHIRRMSAALAQKQTRLSSRIIIPPLPEQTASLPEPVPVSEKSRLAAKIVKGRKVVMVEMVPPRGRVTDQQLKNAAMLKAAGVDAVNIPDGPRASARMNPLALALVLQKNGIETVLHYTCRDRNLLGMQSDLLGAAALGIHNILVITGDPPMMGDYPEATAVFDVDSIGLTKVITALNRGLDIGGRLIGRPTAFFTGAGADPQSISPERELERFFRKADAGAEFFITQPVFDAAALETFYEKTADRGVPLIAGIWPLASLRNAEFMRNEVPGVTVPDAVMERMSRYETKADQLKTGIEIACEMERRVRSFTAGIQVSAPFGKFPAALEVARDLLSC